MTIKEMANVAFGAEFSAELEGLGLDQCYSLPIFSFTATL